MASMEKPVCGSEADTSVYDFPLHVAAVLIVFLASIGGAGFPVVAKKVAWMKIPPKVFFVCKHFGTGVLIATAFVHLVPTAFGSLSDPCLPDLFTKNYTAMPGVIMMGSLFILFVINLWLNAKTGGHSHGGATGQEFAGSSAPPEKPIQRQGSFSSEKALYAQSNEVSDKDLDKDVEQAVDPLVLQKQSLQITLIEGGILFHSVFVGMTVSITGDGFITLLIAIIFHQMFEGLGLGSRIAAVPYPRGSWKPWLLVTAFGTTAPIGQILGLATRNSYDPNSALGLILVGVCNAISSGLLIYAALVDLLAEDFLSEEANHTMSGGEKAAAFCYVLLGAAGMSIVGAFA